MKLSPGHLLGLLGALILAVTGGTLKVDLSAGGPVVKVCSQSGTYEMPLDFGDSHDASVELCCGSCIAVDAQAVAVAGSLPEAPSLTRLRQPLPEGVDGFVRWAWDAPPLRGPPSFV